ncbi:MAG: hypothetical protein LBG27_00350 [Spirochaetaceae bacterium]|jgi:hypothetical protein|nr:hypothetical protein [Spirochaetaceae bacterium]
MKKFPTALIAGTCVFALCVSYYDDAEMRGYVNDHVIAASTAWTEIAGAKEWVLWETEANLPNISEVAGQLRSLSVERGPTTVTPKFERELRGNLCTRS